MKCPLHTDQGAAKSTAAHTLSSDVFLLGWTSCIFTDTGSPSHSITVSDMHQADGCLSFSPSCYFAFHTVMCWVFAICQDVWLQIVHIRFQMEFQWLVADEMSHEWSRLQVEECTACMLHLSLWNDLGFSYIHVMSLLLQLKNAWIHTDVISTLHVTARWDALLSSSCIYQ